ncbi:hypothetical protein CFOL_v3_06848, partial [Cephalotus follicularis]
WRRGSWFTEQTDSNSEMGSSTKGLSHFLG